MDFILDCSYKLDIIKNNGEVIQYDDMDAVVEFFLQNYEKITKIGIISGPGSFYGIRASISLIKGLFLNTMVRVFATDMFSIGAHLSPSGEKTLIFYGIYAKPYIKTTTNVFIGDPGEGPYFIFKHWRSPEENGTIITPVMMLEYMATISPQPVISLAGTFVDKLHRWDI